MPITPLAAAAVPAGAAALQVARQVRQNQPFRQLLSQLGGAREATKTPEGEAESTADPLQQFHALVQQRLASAGIHTSIRFEITSDAAGNLKVSGNHPRSEEIEHALTGDAELTAAFARLLTSPESFAEQYVADASGTSVPSNGGNFSVLINGDKIEIA